MADPTPPPWTLSGYQAHEDSVYVYGQVGHNRPRIAIVQFGLRDGTDPRPQTEANARLIAAAPELLAALEAVVALDGGAWHSVRYASESRDALAQARAAIIKARGES